MLLFVRLPGCFVRPKIMKVKLFSFHKSSYLDCYFQLFSELLDSKETSLLEDAWKTFRTTILICVFYISFSDLLHSDTGRRSYCGSLTSYVYAFIDNELSVSQVVEDGLKVFGAAVDQVSSVLVPLVPPHI